MLFLGLSFSSVLAARSASPMFVPESHGRCCLIVSVLIFCMIFMSPFLSWESGERMNAFPAKTTSPKRLPFSCSSNEIRTFFAHSRRLGLISSASMDFEISSTRVMLFSEYMGYFRVSWYCGCATRRNMRHMDAYRNILRKRILMLISACFCMSLFGKWYPIFS